ncbi:MAG: FAD-dependent oxidoreductase, partial [Synergistaceae bacterium]|nr:FAD-dependent oxidoreductase [Synergistaceae bacterium]
MLKKLFTPAAIGKMELKNRLVVSPMVCNFCDENGEATERFIAYHTEKAKGGWGLIITENYAITPDARGFSRMACMYEDGQITSHGKLTKSVHKHGAKIVGQMVHAGRQTDKSVNTGVQVVAPSAIPCPAKQEMPHELTADEIKRLVSAFGDTARRFKEAGFDGVEIHGGHGYLIAEFMSSYANKRVDEYGGALINRMRFVKEIIDDVRKKTGPDFPVLFRISSEEQMPGGRTIQDTMAIAVLLEEWGIDAIDITCGTYGEDSTIPSMAVSHAWNIDSAARVKSVVSIPVMAVGRINEPVLAEAMLRSDKADFIIMGRGSLADPELPVKAQEGRLGMIRQCIGCLQGCIGRLQTVGEIACLVNPQLGFEYISIDKAPKPLKVAVAGGGPAGIEAARGAAMRGHSVTLYEKSDRLGGNFQIAAYPPYKGELSSYIAWAGRELEKRRVQILYNAEFTASVAKHEKYDAVVIATGAELSIPEGILISGDKALDARELIYGGKAEAGQNVAVLGGGLVGLEAAVHLGWLGRNVTIFEMRDKIAADVESGVLPALLDLVKRYDLTVLTNANVKSVEGGRVKVSINEMDNEYVFDTVALAFGLKPIDHLAEELKGIVPEIIAAGDARVPAKAVEAVRTGFVAGSSI